MLTGKQIAEARKRKGWTQAKLAEKLGVSSEAVSKWEHDAYIPEKHNEQILSEVLELHYLKEDGTPLNGRLFDENHMSAFLRGKLSAGDFPNSSQALSFAKKMHEGQLRKPKELKIPYIIHPLTMACHAMAMGLKEDVIIAALLLHDVCEDCGVVPSELPVCSEVQEIVRLVTKPKYEFSEKDYYEAIICNPKACLVKCIDRCNNVSGMAIGFSPNKIKEYIEETEEWYPHLLKAIKDLPEYNDAAWLLSYQIRSIIQTAKRIN